jgi:hypothetical protein
MTMKLELRQLRSALSCGFRRIDYPLAVCYVLTICGKESRVIVRRGFSFSRGQIARVLVFGLFNSAK